MAAKSSDTRLARNARTSAALAKDNGNRLALQRALQVTHTHRRALRRALELRRALQNALDFTDRQVSEGEQIWNACLIRRQSTRLRQQGSAREHAPGRYKKHLV